MNDREYKIRMFFTTLLSTFGGILPTVACTGSCGTCFQCAGLGGMMAVLAAVGTARKHNQGKRSGRERSNPLIMTRRKNEKEGA